MMERRSVPKNIAFFQKTLLSGLKTMERIILGEKRLIPLRFSSLK
jgi:hypothetical protein